MESPSFSYLYILNTGYAFKLCPDGAAFLPPYFLPPIPPIALPTAVTAASRPSALSADISEKSTPVFAPMSSAANTADDSQMVLWLGSAVLAAAAVVVLTRKKRVSK